MKRLVLIFISLAFIPRPAPAATDTADYSQLVKPLLKERCYACHGALKQKAGLRVDTVLSARKGGESGPAIEPRRAAQSLLIQRVTSADADTRMPPEGQPLTEQQVALLKAWIGKGAAAPVEERAESDPREHWSFRPPQRPAVPVRAGKPSGWERNPIDAFVADEYEKRGLTAVLAADKPVLLRRVYLDLIGLPPTREQLHAFLEDRSPDAYEKVVDQLLGNAQYGERWGRHWMDVWRYSDWYGRRAVPDVMNSYAQIWRWRDWIVRSLNADKGYDRMVMEMLAADEIAPADDENLVATGFIVRNWFKWNYNTWMKDQVEHTGKAFLGLTLNCAHCHDHKYDPISQEDYFRFRAFFEPLELRHDRVAGERDPGPFRKYVYTESYGPIATGMVRVFDEKLDAQTFLYAGGDTRNKVEGKAPIAPGVPAAMGGSLKVQPVDLPLTAWYPGLKPFVLQEETAKLVVKVASAETALATAKLRFSTEKAAATTMPTTRPENGAPTTAPTTNPATRPATSVIDEAQLAVRAAEAELAAARSHLLALSARIAADRVKYLPSGEPSAHASVLARAASAAERQAAYASALATVARAGHATAVAQAKAQTDEKAKPAAASAEQQWVVARTAATVAETALNIESDQYSPLSPIYPRQSTGRRAALAQWIVGRDNPLTARVAVNHVWLRHFGSPLVATPYDFGRNGKSPTHPQLLDWLSVELMEHDWSMKHLHRVIVTSATYRMSSQTGHGDIALTAAYEANVKADPDNHFLWRFNPQRIEAEAVRDSVLHVAGELDTTLGGPDIDHRQGLTSRRRSLYFTHNGEEKMQLLDLFDGANATDCYRRTDTVVPQQALALTNSEFSTTYARVLARKLWQRVVIETSAEPAVAQGAFVTAAFEQVLTRGPTSAETAACLKFLNVPGPAPGELAAPATQPVPKSAGPTTGASEDPAMAARESLVHVLMNHTDFVTTR